MTKLHEAANIGQSLWLDYISRSLIESGELKNWVDKGLRGVTSNPSIFEKAINGSSDYDGDIKKLVAKGKSTDEIYEALVMNDIADAADILRPVYDATDGLDGYVSLEVSPKLAYNTKDTIADAKRLFSALNRPNIFIKVPATPEGAPAIKELISAGININVTLIFSTPQYEAIAEAYIAGLENLSKAGRDISKIASVASFFVSRIDSVVDPILKQANKNDLLGKTAIACAKMVYARFREIFAGERWEKLSKMGARVQRPLWGSTSTKNPDYLDTIYVDNLIGPDTVNTVPTNTLSAFLDHGVVSSSLEFEIDKVKTVIDLVSKTGIDLDEVTEKLQTKGVEAFAESFDTLMASISKKREAFKRS
jgi:transaldolase